MKSLRNLAVCAIACALCSAAPTRGVEPKANPAPTDPRSDVVKKYFAAAAQAPAQPPKDRTDPKWVELMQQTLKELTDENVKLRREMSDLRDQKDFLNRRLEECEKLLLQQKENRRVWDLVVPPPQGNAQVPPNWKPFEFNGATYYMIPLEQGGQGNVAPRKNLILTPPEAKK